MLDEKKMICNVPDVDQIKTGEKLKALRKNAHYTVSDIADYTNVSVSAVYAWEIGKHLPSISNLTALAVLYDLKHLDDLLVLTRSA